MVVIDEPVVLGGNTTLTCSSGDAQEYLITWLEGENIVASTMTAESSELVLPISPVHLSQNNTVFTCSMPNHIRRNVSITVQCEYLTSSCL